MKDQNMITRGRYRVKRYLSQYNDVNVPSIHDMQNNIRGGLYAAQWSGLLDR